jgi:hypothetical protein
MKFVTIKQSHYPSDLMVLKTKLESEGIPCRLKNELTTQVLSHLATFYAELQVPESYLEQALKIIRESGKPEGSEEK